jgi:hypothetical protein
VSRSASARASSPPAADATASCSRRLLTYRSSSMAPVWHHNGATSMPIWRGIAAIRCPLPCRRTCWARSAGRTA